MEITHHTPHPTRVTQIRTALAPYHSPMPHTPHHKTAHHRYTDNAYTNLLAVWVLDKVQSVLDLLPAETREALCEKVGLTEGVLQRMQDISQKMAIHFEPNGVIQQFKGFTKLQVPPLPLPLPQLLVGGSTTAV